MGLVHEIMVNSNHPEEYESILPSIRIQRIKAYSTKYQVIFFFSIWSIWEERKYLKLYPSVQLWELHTHNPVLSEPCSKLPLINLVKETKAAAKTFFTEAYEQAVAEKCSIHIEGNIMLYDYVASIEKSETRIPKMFGKATSRTTRYGG